MPWHQCRQVSSISNPKSMISALSWAFLLQFGLLWAPFLLCCFSLLIRMVEMTEQSVEIKTTLDEGVKVVSTRVRNYFDFMLPGINNRAEIHDKTRPSQETGRAAQGRHERIRHSNCIGEKWLQPGLNVFFCTTTYMLCFCTIFESDFMSFSWASCDKQLEWSLWALNIVLRLFINFRRLLSVKPSSSPFSSLKYNGISAQYKTYLLQKHPHPPAFSSASSPLSSLSPIWGADPYGTSQLISTSKFTLLVLLGLAQVRRFCLQNYAVVMSM